MEEWEPHKSDVEITGTLIALMSHGEYLTAWNMTRRRNLSMEELRQGVAMLGDPLVPTPTWEWSHVAVSRCTDERHVKAEDYEEGEHVGVAYDLVVPLWTTKGRSPFGLLVHLIPTRVRIASHVVVGFVRADWSGLPEGPPSDPPPAVCAPRAPVRPSDNPVPERWRPLLGKIVHRLVIGDYAGLAADGFYPTNDPTDASIGRWIEEYPATLVDLPPEAWAYSSYGPVVGEQGAWWVIVDLWTAEEGHSDLSLEATIWDDGANVTVEITEVHVM